MAATMVAVSGKSLIACSDYPSDGEVFDKAES